MPEIELIQVSYHRGSALIKVGRLAYKNRKIFFEYDPSFIETGLEISPFKLPLKRGIQTSSNSPFEGLFGVFNDSLPDGWGRFLLDRKLLQMGLNPESLTPLDRLRYVGSHGMGALIYEPEVTTKSLIHPIKDLDLIAKECLEIEEHKENSFVEDLLRLNGSSAGARPKILIRLTKEGLFKLPNNKPSMEDSDWMIKFSSSIDPHDIGAIEYAYHLMAVAAGLNVPEAKLFPAKKGCGYFGVKRFDRSRGHFVHMHTLSGLLHADHKLPCLDYETILKATQILTKDIRECEKQFRLAVFNVFAHNRDDHAKNFSFLMNEEGMWQVSPAYDLTYSSGPLGEHCSMIMREGANPNLSHLIKLSEVVQIKKQTALEIIEQVKSAVSKWKDFANESNVSKTSYLKIQTALDRLL